MTCLGMQLVLEPSKVKVQVGALHGLWTPAGQLGDDPRGHVDDKAIRAVQQVEEGAPHRLTLARCVLTENLDTATVLLIQITMITHCWQLFFDINKYYTWSISSSITRMYWMVWSLETWPSRLRNVFAHWARWSFRSFSLEAPSAALSRATMKE